jgi:predicted nucleic acid-binding Zn ribbon protein
MGQTIPKRLAPTRESRPAHQVGRDAEPVTSDAMPTYVYRFVDSGETIEVQQAFTDDPLTEAVHPSTGEVKAVKKVFTPVGVTFKGGGFYKTDSRGSSSRTAAASSSSSSDSGGSSSGGSSDSSGNGSSSSSKESTTSSSSGSSGSSPTSSSTSSSND